MLGVGCRSITYAGLAARLSVFCVTVNGAVDSGLEAASLSSILLGR